jgi:hypothetical protein
MDRLDEQQVGQILNPLKDLKSNLQHAQREVKVIDERQQRLNEQTNQRHDPQKLQEFVIRQRMINEDREKAEKVVNKYKQQIAPLEAGLEKELQRIAREENADIQAVRLVADKYVGYSDNLGWLGQKMRAFKRAVGIPVIKPPEAEVNETDQQTTRRARKSVKVSVEIQV